MELHSWQLTNLDLRVSCAKRLFLSARDWDRITFSRKVSLPPLLRLAAVSPPSTPPHPRSSFAVPLLLSQTPASSHLHCEAPHRRLTWGWNCPRFCRGAGRRSSAKAVANNGSQNLRIPERHILSAEVSVQPGELLVSKIQRSKPRFSFGRCVFVFGEREHLYPNQDPGCLRSDP